MTDPNELLRALRGALQHFHDVGHDMDDRTSQCVRTARELFADLDAHLSAGGEPPIDWRDGVNDMPAPGRTDTTELPAFRETTIFGRDVDQPVHTITAPRTTVMEAIQDRLYRHAFVLGSVVELTGGKGNGGWPDSWTEGTRVRVVEHLPTNPDAPDPIYAVRDSDGLRGLAFESEIRL